MNKLQRKVMIRVYYAFFTRVASHPIMIECALFVAALLVFAKMVHVRSVIDNMLATQVGSLPNFFMSAVSGGEVLTLIAIGVMTFIVLSIPLQLRAEFAPRVQVI